MNLKQFAEDWRDSEYVNKGIHERFAALVNADAELKAHRDWVESNIFGFGERSFHWLHKIVVDEMRRSFKFLEIGGFRMQVVTLYALLANRTGRNVERHCVSPMSGAGGHWESDYFGDSKKIHEQFGLTEEYKLYHGLSTSADITNEVAGDGPYDVVYIDGGHDAATVKHDMRNYAPLVKVGGYLICDDCSNGLQMWPGSFPGILPVSIEVDSYMKGKESTWKHLGAVMHNRIWQKLN